MDWQRVGGWFDFNRVYDEAIDEARDGGLVVEIGCWLGKSTLYLGLQAKKQRPGKHVAVLAVDTWLGSKTDTDSFAGELAIGDPYLKFMRHVIEAGLTGVVTPCRLESVEAAKLVPPGSADFVFIDGDHSTPSVIEDIAAWLPIVMPGGTIAGHDWHHARVRNGVLSHFPENRIEVVTPPNGWPSWRVRL